MKIFLAVAVLACSQFAALAVPTLQLDVVGGYYDDATDTIVASGNPFRVHALVNTDSSKYFGLNGYFISAAVIPQGTPLTDAFGSFSVNGVTYSAAANNMQFGTPPVDAYLKQHDMAPHGIYETSYAEVGFSFNSANHAIVYNVEDNPDGFVDDPTDGAPLLYQTFDIDISGLAAGYMVHIDLYHATYDSKKGVWCLDQFAPFSHDAESGENIPNVPDGGSTLLLLAGAIGAMRAAQTKLKRHQMAAK